MRSESARKRLWKNGKLGHRRRFNRSPSGKGALEVRKGVAGNTVALEADGAGIACGFERAEQRR